MTGGRSGGDFLSSTELLMENGTSWLYLPQAYPGNGVYGNLPTPRSDFSGLNVDNRVLMFGKLYIISISNQISIEYKEKYFHFLFLRWIILLW